MDPEVTVYTISGSCSDAVTALCAHLGLRAEIRERKLHGDALAAVNPERTVPTLVTTDGLVLTETPAILNYLARNYAAELLGRGGVERARNEEMLGFLATSVYNAFLLRFRPDRSADTDLAREAIRAKSVPMIDAALDSLEARHEGRTFSAGESLTTSDFLLLVMLNWADKVDPALLRRRPRLAACADRLRAMPFHSRAFGADAA